MFAAEFLHQPDADHPVLAVVRGPLDVDDVVQGGRQFAQRSEVDGSGWALGLDVRFVGWDGVWQVTHLVVDLNTNTGGELVTLLHHRVQLAEPQLDLVEIVQLGAHPDVSVAGNVGGLLWGEEELELRLLEPVAALGHQGGRLQQLPVDVVERESLELDVDRLGQRLGGCGGGLEALLTVGGSQSRSLGSVWVASRGLGQVLLLSEASQTQHLGVGSAVLQWVGPGDHPAYSSLPPQNYAELGGQVGLVRRYSSHTHWFLPGSVTREQLAVAPRLYRS